MLSWLCWIALLQAAALAKQLLTIKPGMSCLSQGRGSKSSSILTSGDAPQKSCPEKLCGAIPKARAQDNSSLKIIECSCRYISPFFQWTWGKMPATVCLLQLQKGIFGALGSAGAGVGVGHGAVQCMAKQLPAPVSTSLLSLEN